MSLCSFADSLNMSLDGIEGCLIVCNSAESVESLGLDLIGMHKTDCSRETRRVLLVPSSSKQTTSQALSAACGLVFHVFAHQCYMQWCT